MHFYKNISEFVKEHAAIIAGIDEKRVNSIINTDQLIDEIVKLFENYYIDKFQRVLERRYDNVEDIEIEDVNIDLDDYYICEMNDGSLMLMVSFICYVSVMADIENDDYYFNDNYPKYKKNR